MARTFNGTSDQIKTSVATASNVGFGTFAAIVKITSFSATRALMRFSTSGGSNVLGMFVDTSGKVGMSNAASAPAGATSVVANEWYLLAVGKATGTTTPRAHLYRFSTATWVHENTGGTAANATVPGTTGSLVHGSRWTDQYTPQELIVDAFWASNLSDAAVEALISGGASDLALWKAASPTGLWSYNQASTSDAVADLSGNGQNQTSISGTSVTTGAPSGWSYGPTGTAALTVAAPALSASGTVSSGGITGDGAVTIAAPALTAAGTFTTTGSGGLTIAAPSLAASGTYTPEAVTGTGAVTIGPPSLSAAGTFTVTGSGAVTLQPPTLSGSGTATPAPITGTGAVTLTAPAVSASGTVADPGTGSGGVTIAGPALSGSGTVIALISGSGVVTILAPSLLGSGSVGLATISGTGSVVIAAPRIAGYSSLATRATATDAAMSMATATDSAYSGASGSVLAVASATASDTAARTGSAGAAVYTEAAASDSEG